MKGHALKPGWRITRFGDVVRNASLVERDPEAAGIDKIVGLDDLDPGNLHVRRWGTPTSGTSFSRRFNAGQTLFGKRRAYQHKVAYAEFEGICSSDILTFESKDKNVLLPELLPFVCQTDSFFEHALGTSAGSLSPRTSWGALSDFEFALPPIEEQKRIAEILWAADDVVEKCSAVDDALLSEQHALLTQYMPPDAPFDALREGHIPGVCSGRLRDVCEKITDGTHQPPVFTKTGIPFLLIENITPGGIDWSVSKWISEETYARLTKTLRPQRGDVLYTVVGRFGDAILVDWDRPFAFQRHIAVIRPRTGVIDSQFLCYFLQSSLGKKQANIYAEGLAQRTITLGSLGKFCIPTPPIEAQKRICHDLDTIGARRRVSQDASESCKRLLAEMRNGLIAGVAHV